MPRLAQVETVTSRDSAAELGDVAIWTRGVRKSFGRVAALRGVDLDVQRGQFLTILGANGSGKTTFLRILATLASPTAGSVRVEGIDPRRNAPAVRRRIGVVMHQPLLYGDLTVGENLAFYARMYGLPDRDHRIDQALTSLGIQSKLDVKARTLSHGMQKRVSIARALLHDPSVLLLDEPESGLDPEAVEMLEQALLSPGERERRTVVMTTHNLERGLTLGDRVAILSYGRIAFQGTRGGVTAAGLRDAYTRLTGPAS